MYLPVSKDSFSYRNVLLKREFSLLAVQVVNARLPNNDQNNDPNNDLIDPIKESRNVMMDRVWKTKIWIDQLKLESVSLDFATGGETGVSGAPVASLV